MRVDFGSYPVNVSPISPESFSVFFSCGRHLNLEVFSAVKRVPTTLSAPHFAVGLVFFSFLDSFFFFSSRRFFLARAADQSSGVVLRAT